MKNAPTLANLDSIVLNEASAALLASAKSRVSKDLWGRRIIGELSSLCALCQEAPYRLRLLHLDLDAGPLRVILALHCPVPLRPVEGGPLRRAESAMLGIVYPREVLLGPLPGTSFVTILEPGDVFHPNVAAIRPQQMCLGATIRGFPFCEILVLAYASIGLQICTVDRFDHVGVLNSDAARWFEANPGVIPLTREPFLRGPPASVANESGAAQARAGGVHS
ncbi:MAG: hypothetical protein HY343_01385 [Lentisphaerae bacterium]|nr:hypothetical protein [Lentisphaerota bacterium]